MRFRRRPGLTLSLRNQLALFFFAITLSAIGSHGGQTFVDQPRL